MGEIKPPQPDIQKNPEEKKEGHVELNIEPRFKEKWGDFLTHCGPNAIALDGRVVGKTQYDSELPAANFNHHEGVDRAKTDATCKQVFDALKSDDLKNFQKDNQPDFRLFVEDCDGDVSTCVALFEMYCEDKKIFDNARLKQLVMIENNLDKSFGINPDDDQNKTTIEQIEEILWVYEPYQSARRQGKTAVMDTPGMSEIIKKIGERIRKFVDNKAEKITYDGRYKVLGGGKDWTMVKEIGNEARMQIIRDGMNAILSVEEIQSPEDTEPKWRYTFIKTSAEVEIPISELCAFFNKQEGIDPTSTDTWGGSNLNFGSPRSAHSKTPPEKMEQLLNKFLEDYNK